MIRVFAWRLLTTSPPWIAERIDVRCPEVQASPVSIVEGTGFGRDDFCDFFDQVIIKSGAHQDGLREGGRVAIFHTLLVEIGEGPCDAMETFGPPLVRWDPEASHAWRPGGGGIDLLLKGVECDQRLGPGKWC